MTFRFQTLLLSRLNQMQNRFNFPLFSWHLEVSSKCALACLRCPRTGEANKHKYKVTELKLDFIQFMFHRDFLEQQVRRILFCGGQGDPIYNSQFLEMVSYLKSTKPDLTLWIVTNGSYKNKSWWQQLASVLNEYDLVIFSVDGWDQQSNEQYRVNSNFFSIIEGIQEMVKSAASIHWSTILFKFNSDKIENIRELARSLGVDYFTLVKSTKFGVPWVKEGEVDPLEPETKFVSEFAYYTRQHTPLSQKPIKRNDIYDLVALRKKQQQEVYKNSNLLPQCQVGDWSWYVDASAILYPCSWLSHPYDMSEEERHRNLWLTQRDRFDLSQRSLDEVLNDSVWQELIAGWKGRAPSFRECSTKCTITHKR